MPLLVSPIDGAPMRQIHRYGIEFDVCPTSGGVWLDKGELEKLMMLVKEEVEAERARHAGFARRDDDDDRGRYRDDKHRYREDKDRYRDEKGRPREGGWRKSRLMDLFDF